MGTRGLDRHSLLIRSLSGRGKAIAVLLAIIFSNKQMVSEEDISGIVGCSPKTARTGLNVLNTMGLITRTHFHSGWTLTESGRQMFLQSPQLRLQAPTNDAPDADLPQNDQPGKNYRVIPENVQPGKIYRVSPQITGSDDDVVVNLNNNLKTTTPTTTESQLYQTALRICEAVETIWGSSIWPNVAQRVSENELRRRRGGNSHLPGIQDLVGWIAHCHHNPNRAIKDPAAVVAADILGCRRPGRKYKEHPEDYLPDGFFSAAGLEITRVTDPAQTSVIEHIPGDEPDELVPPDRDDSVLQLINGMSAQAAWDLAVEQLSQTMPLQAWQTWVEPAWLQEYADGIFSVAVPNAYGRDWLESRLTATIIRHLSGICNQAVSVRFELFGGQL